MLTLCARIRHITLTHVFDDGILQKMCCLFGSVRHLGVFLKLYALVISLGGGSNWVRPLGENYSSLKVTGHRKEFEPHRGPGGRDGALQAKIVVEADKV